MADLPRFGANEFYLVETDPLAIREQLRAALAELLGRDVLDSDPHMVLASAFMPFFVQGQASADAAAKATLRAFAVGADLDRIADSTCVVGYMDRLPARGAILACIVPVTVTRAVYTAASTVTVTVEASRDVTVGGADLTFSGRSQYSVSFNAAVASRTLVLPVYLTCSEPSAQYNGLFSALGDQPVADGDISANVSAVDESGDMCEVSDVSALRCGSTYGGADAEDDDSFARRVAWQAKALRVPGSYEYFLLLLSGLHLLASSYVSQRVDTDGRIVMAWCDKAGYYADHGGYTLTDKGPAYDEFRDAVQGSLLVEQRVMAYPAQEFEHSYGVTYKLPATTSDVTSARAAVDKAWRAYLASHAWHCGAILNVAEMQAVLSGAGASEIQVATAASDYEVLPADTMIPDHKILIAYLGLSVDSADPAGSDGEEITP